jgi:hypothetical protein
VPFAALAKREGVSPSYFTRVLRLSYLASDIIRRSLRRRGRGIRMLIDGADPFATAKPDARHEISWSCVLPHFEVTAFLAAAIGLLGLISLCLLVFGRLGVGSIVAFLVAGIVIGQVRDIPAQTILAVHEFAEIGVVLLLFLIGLEIQLDQLRRLGRDVLAFGVPKSSSARC